MPCTAIFLTGPKKGQWYTSAYDSCQILKKPKTPDDKAELIVYSYVEYRAGAGQYAFWIEPQQISSNSDLGKYIMDNLIKGLEK